MTAAALFLGFAILCAACALLSILRLTRLPGPLLVPIFLLCLPLTELPLHALMLELVVTAVFLSLGALDGAGGQWALALILLSALILLWQLRWHRQTAALFARTGSATATTTVTPLPLREWLLPMPALPRDVEKVSDIAYGEHDLQTLDIYHSRKHSGAAMPVMLYIHGGGWYIGDKRDQGLPLIYHMASHGWICVSVNYRLSPTHRFPAHIIDVKRAIAWTRENIDGYGGDAGFIATAGGSAGAHLSALAALTADEATWQPGFESADTRVQALVSMYGMYDFLDQHDSGVNRVIRELLREKIMPTPASTDIAMWRDASPLNRVRVDAPPTLIVHGSHDPMMSPVDAKLFAQALRARSENPVHYIELPGANHAFDLLASQRTAFTVRGIQQFLMHTLPTRPEET